MCIFVSNRTNLTCPNLPKPNGREFERGRSLKGAGESEMGRSLKGARESEVEWSVLQNRSQM